MARKPAPAWLSCYLKGQAGAFPQSKQVPGHLLVTSSFLRFFGTIFSPEDVVGTHMVTEMKLCGQLGEGCRIVRNIEK